MLRVFRRSKLPIWYTEGFNPHPYFSFALALSLGFESSCEILDFNLNEELPFDTVRDRLNAVMPEGMRIVSVSDQNKKITEIAKAEYEIALSSDDPARVLADIENLLTQNEILVEKKTKKGIKNVDLKPFIEITGFGGSDELINIGMRLPAGTQTNYNPTLFLDALKKAYNTPFETENIRRTSIFCENYEFFS